MIKLLLVISYLFSNSSPNPEEARQIYYNDHISYKSSRAVYMDYFSKYRNQKLSEDYRERVNDLEEQLVKGNKKLLNVVESFQQNKKDKVLLDDELLMRLAQLEFDRAGFEVSQKMSESGGVLVYPDYSKSLEYAKRLLKNFPNSQLADSAEYLIAYVHEELGEFQKAKRIYEYFVNKYPNSKFYNEVRWRLSEIQFENGEIKKSRRGYLELAKKVNSKFEFKALYKLGATLYDSKLYEWSSKMFLRLYDRLKDDHVSNAERVTLYDETLEYLGLIQRKGVAIDLTQEVEAKSTQMVVKAFKRHGLFNAASKTIEDYIEMHPNSSFLPEFYDEWIQFEEERGNTKKAHTIRQNYISKITNNKDWWRANKVNYQARFFAEESLENHLLSSARYLVRQGNKNSKEQAISIYKYYLKNYGVGRDADEVRLELANLYAEQKQYAKVYNLLKDIPYQEDYTLVYDSIYYLRSLSGIRSKTLEKQELLDQVYQYVSWTQNYNQSASLLLSTQYILDSTEAYYNHYAKLPYSAIGISTDTILNAYKKYQEYSLALGKTNTDNSLYSKLALSKFIKTKADSKSLVDEYIRAGFNKEAIDLIESSRDLNKDEKSFYKAYIHHDKAQYKDSNDLLNTISHKSLQNAKRLLMVKNYYDILAFDKAENLLTKIESGFKRKYLEAEYIQYKISTLKRNYIKAWKSAKNIYLVSKDMQFLKDTASHLHAYRKIDNNWYNAFKEFDEIYNIYAEYECSNKSAICSYKAGLNAIKNKNIQELNASFSELFSSKNLDYIEKLYFEISKQGKLNWLVGQDSFITLYKEMDLDVNLSSPYHYVTQRLHSYFQATQIEFLIPWDLALHSLVEWQTRGPSSLNAIVLCNEGKWKACRQEIEPTSYDNLLKYNLMSLDKNGAKAAIENGSYANSNALKYLLGLGDGYIEGSYKGDYDELAEIKSLLNFSDPARAFKEGISYLSQNPKQEYAYIILLQASLVLKDYPSFSFVLKRMKDNTDSKWAKLTHDFLYGSNFLRAEESYYYQAYNAWKNNNLDYLQSNMNQSWMNYSKAMINLLHNEKYEIGKIDNPLDGVKFVMHLSGNIQEAKFDDILYSQFRDSYERNVASEVEK